MQTFKLFEKNMVAGLNWEPLPVEYELSPKPYIQKLAKEQDLNFYILVKGADPQVGLGACDPKTIGKYSIASLLYQSLQNLGGTKDIATLLKVDDDTYLYYGQRNGAILYDGDYSGTLEQVLERFSTHTALYGPFETLFADSTVPIEGAQIRSIDELLGTSFRNLRRITAIAQAKVRPVFIDKKKRNFYIAIGIIALVLVIAIFKAVISYQATQAAIKIQEEQARLAVMMEENAPKPIYQLSPTASEVTQSCLSAFNEHSISLPNWLTSEVECGADEIVIKLTKGDEGRYETLMEAYPGAGINLATKSGLVRIEKKVTPSYIGKINLPSMSDVYLNVDKAHSYGVDLKFKQAGTGANLPGQEATTKEFTSLEWLIAKTPLLPSRILDFIDNPGLRITKITKIYGASGSLWNIEGTQYAK